MNNCNVLSKDSARRDFMPRRGFTLVELLVVIGILVLLIAILLPAISRSWRSAQITSERADLAALATGLKAYAADFEDYPRNPTLPRDTTGNPAPFYSLAIAMLGPGPKVTGTAACNILTLTAGNTEISTPGSCIQLEDGSDGLGFRNRNMLNPQTGTYNLPVGKVWGPYVSADSFKVAWELPVNNPVGDTAYQPVLLDRWGTPIQYFPLYGPVSNRTNDSAFSTFNASVTAGPLYGTSTPKSVLATGFNALFDQRDATNIWSANSATYALALKWALGDTTTTANYIGSGQTLKLTDPFILISAGPNATFCNIGTTPATYGTNFISSGNVYSISQ